MTITINCIDGTVHKINTSEAFLTIAKGNHFYKGSATEIHKKVRELGYTLYPQFKNIYYTYNNENRIVFS